jgi:phospholipase/carboxylesterase
VVLLHGYGANGDDLIALGEGWRRQLPQAAFVAPNAPEAIPGMPGALQWFPPSILSASTLPGTSWRSASADGSLACPRRPDLP